MGLVHTSPSAQAFVQSGTAQIIFCFVFETDDPLSAIQRPMPSGYCPNYFLFLKQTTPDRQFNSQRRAGTAQPNAREPPVLVGYVPTAIGSVPHDPGRSTSWGRSSQALAREHSRHPRSRPPNSPTHRSRILESGKMGEMDKNGGGIRGNGQNGGKWGGNVGHSTRDVGCGGS